MPSAAAAAEGRPTAGALKSTSCQQLGAAAAAAAAAETAASKLSAVLPLGQLLQLRASSVFRGDGQREACLSGDSGPA